MAHRFVRFRSLIPVAVLAIACSGSTGSSPGGLSQDAGNVSDGGTDGGTGTDGGMGTDGGTTLSASVTQTNLVSDGTVPNTKTDAHLVNPWGIAASPTGPFWISDNGAGVSTLYDSAGNAQSLVVNIPAPTSAGMGATAAPTGVVFNTNTANFKGDTFIFATEDGTIAGWQSGTDAVIRVDNSSTGAVYKGLAISGNMLFVANFNAGAVEMFDANYVRQGSLKDTTLPSGFAPFNVANLGGNLYVSFAKQDAMKHDDVPGMGNGFIDVFDSTGTMMKRLISNGVLDSPWGMVLAPNNFGSASGKLLVGNFGMGDNHINVFDPTTGNFLGALASGGQPLTIEGLWGLAFGNGGMAGPQNTLFFTAGPGMEKHGLFGKLDVMP